MDKPVAIQVDYFSDVLCIWAYIAQIRVDELCNEYGEKVILNYHFIPIFGCIEKRLGEGWKEKGGFEGYNKHVLEVCKDFGHLEVHPMVWLENVPKSSAGCHHFLSAVKLLESKDLIPGERQSEYDGRTPFEETLWRMRLAFFRDLKNIGGLDVQIEIAESLHLPIQSIIDTMESGEAMARMCCDNELKDQYKIEGSPTYILNSGRQKLFGNVGYKIIDANIREILNRRENQLSWC